ncbi:MAG TPA: serine/threonine-protein kinase, partial [Polyangiaceae bacterium]|nr:serine/threonine-protein kinase [Polyangiaceae bacterium]
MLEPGTKVGAYRIGEQLGAGTMGRVYRASRDADGAVVALKVMLPETARHESLRKRVYREARTAMAVNHPNIVRIHEVFEHEALPVLVMEYLEGESLRTRLKRERRIDLQTLAQVMVRVTSALGTAHAHGVIH